jgi:hypothetical protein
MYSMLHMHYMLYVHYMPYALNVIYAAHALHGINVLLLMHYCTCIVNYVVLYDLFTHMVLVIIVFSHMYDNNIMLGNTC